MKVYEVKLSPTHPGNEYRRGGRTFTSRRTIVFDADPQLFTEEQMSDEVRNDPNLTVTEIPGDAIVRK